MRTAGGGAELQVVPGSAGFTGRLASDNGAIDPGPLFGTAGKNRRIDVRSGDESARSSTCTTRVEELAGFRGSRRKICHRSPGDITARARLLDPCHHVHLP